MSPAILLLLGACAGVTWLKVWASVRTMPRSPSTGEVVALSIVGSVTVVLVLASAVVWVAQLASAG